MKQIILVHLLLFGGNFCQELDVLLLGLDFCLTFRSINCGLFLSYLSEVPSLGKDFYSVLILLSNIYLLLLDKIICRGFAVRYTFFMEEAQY